MIDRKQFQEAVDALRVIAVQIKRMADLRERALTHSEKALDEAKRMRQSVERVGTAPPSLDDDDDDIFGGRN